MKNKMLEKNLKVLGKINPSLVEWLNQEQRPNWLES
ncbi:unnamed protein product, partial [marine sediment metagenome]